jgi:KipI family sensor histidine kinase inhibitor
MTAVLTPVGEHAVRFALPPHLDRRALLEHLRALPGVRDASVAAEHALVVFDGEPGELVVPERLTPHEARATEHEIRVAYDGPDLAAVAATLALDVESVVALHAAKDHTALFLGFCPGFAYLGPVEERLRAIARRSSPRTRVPAGSVALAGGYTGIYPADTAGGWQLLGRAIDFDAFAGDHTRFAVGDVVRFVPA